MAKEIKMYEAEDGSTHKDEKDAICADMIHLLRQCDAINEASATKLVNRLVNDGVYRDALIDAFAHLNAAYPKVLSDPCVMQKVSVPRHNRNGYPTI